MIRSSKKFYLLLQPFFLQILFCINLYLLIYHFTPFYLLKLYYFVRYQSFHFLFGLFNFVCYSYLHFFLETRVVNIISNFKILYAHSLGIGNKSRNRFCFKIKFIQNLFQEATIIRNLQLHGHMFSIQNLNISIITSISPGSLIYLLLDIYLKVQINVTLHIFIIRAL